MINSFKGPYRFLSNFYPCIVTLDGVDYPTVEHAFQAAKTLDTQARNHIRGATTPSEAKRLGRQVVLRPDWDKNKLVVMYRLLYQKFVTQYRFGDMLTNTGDTHLEEGNTWGDRYWGTVNGTGENHLGKLLMKIREELRNGSA